MYRMSHGYDMHGEMGTWCSFLSFFKSGNFPFNLSYLDPNRAQ
jgi:hypothetical protein